MTDNQGNDHYFDTSAFIAELNDCRKFSIFHVNIRSFNRNSDELLIFLSQLPIKPSVIVLSETWFSSFNVAELVGYRAVHVFRDGRRGGGISAYVKVAISSVPVHQLCYVSDTVEMCSVNINIDGSKIKIIGMYRPPDGSVRTFTDELSGVISSLDPREKVFLVGDLNIDLIDPNLYDREYIDICFSNSFLPLITCPTRISNNSASCIDHIWFSQLEETVSGVLKLDISDHFAVFTTIKLSHSHSEFIQKKFRDHSEKCVKLLRDRVSTFVSEFDMCHDIIGDVNDATLEFSSKLYNIYDTCCPLRTKTISARRMIKPWITNELVNCVNRKHCLFRLYKRGIVSFFTYNNFKNVLTSVIRRAKYNYFVTKFDSGLGCARETWRNVNRLFFRRAPSSCVDEVVKDGDRVRDRLNIARIFNEYFSSIGTRLDENIPPSRISPLDYMDISCPNSIFLQPSLSTEVSSVIQKLPIKPSTFSSVPVYMFKQIVDLISPVICSLFNASISTGVFPDSLKVARIVPIHKSGDRSVPSNYRPISVLSVLSKIFEKMMFTRVQSFIKENKLLYDNQFGFRENASTSDAVSQFLNFVFESLSSKVSLSAVFIDFSKAFDTVNHRILCDKLHHIGFRGVALKWFQSYLTGRRQYVDIGGVSSPMCDVELGVPQGSVLGPILFLIYINDMCRASTKLQFIHFADDTTVFHYHNDIDALTYELNSELSLLNEWFIANRLSLNTNKTSFMFFSDRKTPINPVIRISDTILKRVSNSKFLGIVLDDGLSFVPHIDGLCKQISQAVGMLNRLSAVMPHAARVLVYFSLIYSKLTYGIIVWGCGNVNHLNKLERVVARAHRVVNREFRGRVLNRRFFSVSSAHKYFTAIKFFKSVKLNHHLHFTNMFETLRPSHDHDTRFSISNYNVPLYSKTKCNKSFCYQSVNVWNSLPDYLKQCNSLELFKKQLKIELLDRQ